MTAAKDLADALVEVADLHDLACPKRALWGRLADHVGGDNTMPAPEVTHA